MLLIMNEIDSCLSLPLCVFYEIQNQIFLQQLLQERDELGQELSLWSQFSWTKFAQCLCNLCTVWRLLKQSFYMSRVRRKEGPLTDSWVLRKSELKSKICKPRQIGGVEQVSTSCRALMNLDSLAWFLEQTWRLQY